MIVCLALGKQFFKVFLLLIVCVSLKVVLLNKQEIIAMSSFIGDMMLKRIYLLGVNMYQTLKIKMKPCSDEGVA